MIKLERQSFLLSPSLLTKSAHFPSLSTPPPLSFSFQFCFGLFMNRQNQRLRGGPVQMLQGINPTPISVYLS